MAEQKNTWMIKTLISMLWLCVFTAITVIGNNVIANDKKYTRQHEDIRKEAKHDMEKSTGNLKNDFTKQLDEVKESQKEMRTEQKEFVKEYRMNQMAQQDVNMKILLNLQELKKD